MLEATAKKLIVLMERYDARLDEAEIELVQIDEDRGEALRAILEQVEATVAAHTKKVKAVMDGLNTFHEKWIKDSAAIEGEDGAEVDLGDDPIDCLIDSDLSEEVPVITVQEAFEELIEYEDRGTADARQAVEQMKGHVSTYILETEELEYDEEEAEDNEHYFICDGERCRAKSPVAENDAAAIAAAEKAGWEILGDDETYCPKHAR